MRACVFGAGGYTGVELVSLLNSHPEVELVSVHGSADSVGIRMCDRAPELRGVCALSIEPTDERVDTDIAFLATPHELSAKLVPGLLDRGVRVIDLSGAYRFAEVEQVRRVYGFEVDEDILARRVYGLPELFDADWASAQMVACAGCYVTAASAAIAPLARAGLIAASEPVLVDAVSGVSGAGRGAKAETSFCEVSVRPYKVWDHRHGPEIEMVCGSRVLFRPMIGPWKRGIVSTVHAKLTPGADRSQIRGAFESAYAGCAFVRVLESEQWPCTGAVERTNFVDIGFAVDPEMERVIVVSALDNLVKGASGQAVQCMNLMLGLDERVGLVPGMNREVLA